MGSRKQEKVRGLIEGVSPGPWRIELDANAQANIYDSEGLHAENAQLSGHEKP